MHAVSTHLGSLPHFLMISPRIYGCNKLLKKLKRKKLKSHRGEPLDVKISAHKYVF